MGSLFDQKCEKATDLFKGLPPISLLGNEQRTVPSTRQFAAQSVVGELSADEKAALITDILTAPEPAEYVLDELEVLMGVPTTLNGGEIVDALLTALITGNIAKPEILQQEAANLDAFELQLRPAV